MVLGRFGAPTAGPAGTGHTGRDIEVLVAASLALRHRCYGLVASSQSSEERFEPGDDVDLTRHLDICVWVGWTLWPATHSGDEIYAESLVSYPRHLRTHNQLMIYPSADNSART